MFVEATKMSGTGELLLTGQLGMHVYVRTYHIELEVGGRQVWQKCKKINLAIFGKNVRLLIIVVDL